MFGITSSGCFVLGIIMGFILASIIGVACVFYFSPDIKHKTIDKVEAVWGDVKTEVDNSIDTVKKAPVAEPKINVGDKPGEQPYLTQPVPGKNSPVKPKVTISF